MADSTSRSLGWLSLVWRSSVEVPEMYFSRFSARYSWRMIRLAMRDSSTDWIVSVAFKVGVFFLWSFELSLELFLLGFEVPRIDLGWLLIVWINWMSESPLYSCMG